jgi:AraC family transcriptional regulator of adaptative response / DNA-3-methyladenine glycosylase II
VVEDVERCYRAVQSKDARFDGWFVTCVTTTGIYCRPSCPAVTPRLENVRFLPTAASAQHAGFRACKRCRPDAAPGSPEWDGRADVVARAMRLIDDGVVDREGVGGLAARLGYGGRQLHRVLVAELGAGPLALARAARAQTARLLLETTDLPLAQVAFGAGFGSVRQFNDTVRAVFATTPSALRRTGGGGALAVRLAVRAPFDGAGLLDYLGARAVPGVEERVGDRFRRSLRLPHGAGVVELQPEGNVVVARLTLDDLRDVRAAVARCRRLLDLDADPVAVDALLGADPLLAPVVAKHPGRRVPGAVDGFELAVRAVLGQQVSVAGARTIAGRVVRSCGTALAQPVGGITHLFPEPDALLDADLPVPASRATALRALAASGLALDPGADRAETTTRLLALPGIGPWTADYVRMRALGDPDVFLATDLHIRRHPATPEGWRPWRSYATHLLWAA